MGHKSSQSTFIADLHIELNGKSHSFRLASILRWMLPLIILALKLLPLVRHHGGP